MKKLLWVGDAACGSGFARASHHILENLRHHWHVTVLGVNYTGDPHKEPYDIWPAFPGGDALGVNRLKDLVTSGKPDLIVIQTNPWHVPKYAKVIPKGPMVVGIIAVEGKNCEGWKLNNLDLAIFWTAFGREEAIKGGLTKPSAVIPLGVDLEVFKPVLDKRVALRRAGVPEKLVEKMANGFVVGNINRNQFRKRLDLSVKYFADWIRSRGIDDAWLFLHVLTGSTVQHDLEQLGSYFGRNEAHPEGVLDRFVLSQPDDIFNGFSDETVRHILATFDAQINTGLGEGWGLTAMEGMACGAPQILGDYSAFGEWARDAALLVPCEGEGVMPDVHVMLGAAPKEEAVLAALDVLYNSRQARDNYRRAGFDRVMLPCFRWADIAEQYHLVLSKYGQAWESTQCLSVA